MNDIIGRWFAQAKRDFASAKNSFASKDYYIAVFLCQQAVEKALKAQIMQAKRISDVESHSLIYLAKLANLPKQFYPLMRELTPQYTLTRYPGATEEPPFELFDEKKAKEFIEKSQEVISWISRQLK